MIAALSIAGFALGTILFLGLVCLIVLYSHYWR